MRRWIATALLALAAACSTTMAPPVTDPAPSDPLRVEISDGRLRGVIDDGVLSFKGIPYAAPPIGALRWRPPQPVAPWRNERLADRVGAICMQRHNREDNGVGPLPMSEDCLTLNVWTPEKHDQPLPVMVWIHGGGLVNGSGTAALYDGAALARQGVVVVTLNYRLGRLGFFAHPALSEEQAGGPLGNYGFMDQIAALRWVQANIGAFGGDASNVTIFGESAGGVSVQRLMMIDAARGLFHKAISQSGAGFEAQARLRDAGPGGPSAEQQGVDFARALGVDDLARLRMVPADRIVDGAEPSMLGGFGPITDGVLLREDFMDALGGGRVAPVPLLIGSNALEFPLQPAQFEPMFAGLTRGRANARANLMATYPNEALFQQNVVSDLIFGAPARAIAAGHARNGQAAYLYRFSVLSASMQGRLAGAPHASERQYVFRTLSASTWSTDANDAARAEEMSAYWIAFARTGDPNGENRAAWPRYEAGADMLLNFTNAGPTAQRTPDAASLDAITQGRP